MLAMHRYRICDEGKVKMTWHTGTRLKIVNFNLRTTPSVGKLTPADHQIPRKKMMIRAEGFAGRGAIVPGSAAGFFLGGRRMVVVVLGGA